jgi:DNA-binding FrmR family transcriptional regulator
MTPVSHDNRQCYTIGQAVDFLHDLTQKLDDVESFRLRVLQGDVESVEEWLACMNEFREPVDQLAALRQGIIQDAWSEVIKSNITDGLERYLHMENAEFNFKSPSAETEVGRSKAYVLLIDDSDDSNLPSDSLLAQNPEATVKMGVLVTIASTMSRSSIAVIIVDMEDHITHCTL